MKAAFSRLRQTTGSRVVALALAFTGGAWTVINADCDAAQLLQQAAPNSGPAIGRTAIAFAVQTLDGQSVSLETFRGKPLVVNFFASWCDPCRDEMPILNELAAKSARSYSVLGIAVEDSRAAVTEYAKEAKLVFPIALDLNSRVKRAYRIFGPPATYFIDDKGIIKDMVIGPITRERANEAMRKTVQPSK
jgi:thiol-disulfide isomerase/thioredoxin